MQNLDQLAAELARELGIDAAEIAARQAFLEFSAEDAALLKELHKSLAVEAAGIAEEFYDHLLRFAPLQDLLPNARDLDRLKRQQVRYFKGLFAGSYGEPYVHDRLRVGIVHQRVGLALKWYIGAYRKYLSELIPCLRQRAGNNEQRFIRSLDAVVKIIMFDMGLALDAHFAAGKRAAEDVAKGNSTIEALRAGKSAAKVLIVSENNELRFEIAHALQDLGSEVKMARSDEAMEDMAASEEIAAVVYEASRDGAWTRLVRTMREKAPFVPVILLADFDNIQKAASALSSGQIDRLLLRPLNPVRLSAVVAELLLLSEIADRPGQRGSCPEKTAVTVRT